MKVPEFRQINREDVDIPEGFEPFIGAINQQLERLTSLAQRKIRFDDNFDSSEHTFDLRHNVPRSFTAGTRGTPREVLVVRTGNFSPHRLAWRNGSSPNQLEVVMVWDNAPVDPVRVTLRALS